MCSALLRFLYFFVGPFAAMKERERDRRALRQKRTGGAQIVGTGENGTRYCPRFHTPFFLSRSLEKFFSDLAPSYCMSLRREYYMHLADETRTIMFAVMPIFGMS